MDSIFKKLHFVNINNLLLITRVNFGRKLPTKAFIY